MPDVSVSPPFSITVTVSGASPPSMTVTNGATVSVTVGSAGGGGGPAAWDDITGKPSVFTPSAHASSHEDGGADALELAVTQITGLSSSLSSIGGSLAGKADTTDARFTDSREWTASTVSQAEAEAGTDTTRRAWTAQRVRQAIVAWWTALSVPISKITGLQAALDAKAPSDTPTLSNVVTFVGDDSSTSTINGSGHALGAVIFTGDGSIQNFAFTTSLRTKLNGIATAATANATDAQLRDRSTHTGTQAAGTITGLGGAATLNVGTAAGTVAAGDDSRLTNTRTPTDGTVTTAKIVDANVTIAKLSATGTASASTFLRGDGAWAAAGSTSASDLTSGTLPEGRLPNLVILHPFLLAGM